MEATRVAQAGVQPALALMLNAFTWGVSWWPFRQLEARGLHPLWATVIIYTLSAALIAAWRPRALRQVLGTPTLWVLVLASGTTNAAFNWAVTIGDVVRVVLLFYLMPLWALVLARWLLHERVGTAGLLRVALALVGAAIILWPDEIGLPLPRTLADGLGMLGGFAFALNNVMLRREAHRPEEGRALAMFSGGVLISGVLALLLGGGGASALVPAPPPPALPWLAGVLGLGAVFVVSNLALQYGAARLPANVTAVVMLTEVVFASVTAVWWGGAALSAATLAGGALILLAAALSAVSGR